MYSIISRALAQGYVTLIDAPLRALYFRGPVALGFWGGASPEDICYTLTGTSASFWTQHGAQCAQLCDQKFDTIHTTLHFAVYVVILYRLVNALIFYVCFTRPVLWELRELSRPRVSSIRSMLNVLTQ